MIKARGGWLLAGALSLCVLARAEETGLPTRQIAPPKRIPDAVSAATFENVQPAGEPVNTASMPHAVRRAVVADAAKRFQVAENAVVLARAEQLTWSDGSLGCPEPGQVYTQNLVAGFRVVATTSAGALTYHTDSRGYVVSCGARSSRPARPPTGTGDDASEPRTLPPPRSQPDR
jgi:hypothetical protein